MLSTKQTKEFALRTGRNLSGYFLKNILVFTTSLSAALVHCVYFRNVDSAALSLERPRYATTQKEQTRQLTQALSWQIVRVSHHFLSSS